MDENVREIIELTLAMEILEATNDGDDLTKEHLKLLEAAVNDLLTKAGKRAFAALVADVLEGRYQP